MLAAYVLWKSRVPGDLALPAVDPRDHFSAAQIDRARDYERFLRIGFLLSQVALLVVLALYARHGGRFARESAAGRIGTGMLLAMVGLALVWVVQLPFGLAELWWQRRHDVSRAGYPEWLVDNWLGLGGEFLFISLAILVVMGLARLFPARWWLPGGAFFVGLATLFTFLLPYLIPGQELLRAPALAAEAKRLGRMQGLEELPVTVESVSEFTTSPNAEAAGLGPSRRVILWDTLLEPPFTFGERRFVLAHEVAHHARDHLWKSVGWYALFAFPGAFVIARAARRRGGMAEPAAVPRALFVLVVLSTLALPLQNVVTRHLEREADWVALETTRDPVAARALFRHFSTTALAEPSPPTWSYLLVESHPTIAQRLAMVEAWRQRAEGR